MMTKLEQAAHQPDAVDQAPVAWTANEWSVFNTGAEVASGLSLDEAMDYLTDERAARGWSVVCVINKDNMPTPATHQAARKLLEHDEDLLEHLYWEFDHQRQKTGEERLAFKGKMRFYASEVFKKGYGIGGDA